MKKVAIVVQRCHERIVGGSEALAWQYATLLQDNYDVEVLTSTALDHITWKDELPRGINRKGKVTIRRFSVTLKRSLYWHQLHRRWLDIFEKWSQGDRPSGRPFQTPWTISLEEEFIRHQGPFTESLYQHLEQHQANYHAILFITYLYPTTYFGALCAEGSRAILVPTLHDEPTAYMHAFKGTAQRVGTIFWLTAAEKRLGHKLWGEDRGSITGMAVSTELASGPVPKHRYLLYAGRIEEAKSCLDLVQNFVRWKSEHRGQDLGLVLIGNKQMDLPAREDVAYLGLVSPRKKFEIMRGAFAFVMPSRWESFSAATLEAMAQERPVLVNGQCAVLADHVEASSGGLVFTDYESFCTCLDRLLSDPGRSREMGKSGRDYVLNRYDGKMIQRTLLEKIERAA